MCAGVFLQSAANEPKPSHKRSHVMSIFNSESFSYGLQVELLQSMGFEESACQMALEVLTAEDDLFGRCLVNTITKIFVLVVASPIFFVFLVFHGFLE